jgi:tetrapyrrole methylase family protein / MazG family protein
MENTELNAVHEQLDALFQLVDTLRGENGCPWDKKQTPESVSIYLTEEIFELADAVEAGDSDQIRDELGDVLFQIVFIARMFQERGEFDLADVAQTITQKMVRRHPHVFGDKKINSSEEVIQNWHKIKLGEKKAAAKTSLLDSVPAKLPALLRAYRVSERIAKTGFDDPDIDTGLKKAYGALDKLKAALRCRNKSAAAEKIGDLLFAVVNLARIGKIHPETALAGTVKRFVKKFKKMEAMGGQKQAEI